MLGSLVLLLAQVASPTSSVSSEVVVIGHRAEKELAACLARSCPPAEEVEASLQASVEQFADGRYDDARGTLQNAIGRNRKHAAEMPGPMSSLYATLATVAEHEGNTNLWRASARNNVLVLREHLGASNPATLREELNFADAIVNLGAPQAADDAYRNINRLAVQSRQPTIAAGATFRRAWLALMRDRYDDATRLADEAVALAGPNNKLLVDLREVLLARVAIRRGDEGAVDALASRLRQSTSKQPQLLFAPAMEDLNPSRDQNVIKLNPWNDAKIRFADVGYWIRPDGKTAEVEILRDSGLGQWAPSIMRHVSRRRYVPLAVEAGDPGLYRIDRFTVPASSGTPLNTRIRGRIGNLTVHVIDLTETEAMSAVQRQRTQSIADEGS